MRLGANVKTVGEKTVGDLLLFIALWCAGFFVVRDRDRSRLVTALASFALAIGAWAIVTFLFDFARGFIWGWQSD